MIGTSPAEEQLFESCHANVPNLERYLSRWLMVSEAEFIRRDNVKDFIRWAFFTPGYVQERDQQNEGEVETYVTEIEKLTGRELPPGRMDVKSLGQLLNEAGGSHRSLLCFLRDLDKELERGATDHNEVGIIALEIMPISSRITHPALEKDVMIHEIMEIMRYHGWSRFVLVSHSYGSVIAAHLLKSDQSAPLIGPMVFIDPVSFLLHLPDVAYNFIARRPARANEYQLWYFGSKDIGVAHTLARRFSWVDNIIWKEDLRIKGDNNQEEDRNVTVVLSGKDLIVDAETVGQYLMGSSSGAWTVDKDAAQAWKNRPWVGHGLELLWYEQLDHAQVFDSENTRGPVIRAVSVYSNAI
ncbi:hypothetical protein AtubIFM57258_011136 [Aspergillus tubingensis]|nr:hypothetical protein AtubIFM57258_011136 [Aspergillus tubingensis]